MKKPELLLVEAHLHRAPEAWADDDYPAAHRWLRAAYEIAEESETTGADR